jgi:hypothetical protein
MESLGRIHHHTHADVASSTSRASDSALALMHRGGLRAIPCFRGEQSVDQLFTAESRKPRRLQESAVENFIIACEWFNTRLDDICTVSV